ncbi:hypothetical protein SAMN05920897_101207 [Alkalispirochaeta americana]|uniref:Uncharacterized protein n=1 Tax=Alkalispirochaeta americana TaxID=159291 RepID=A0A1N6NE38_9SPIO|nr:hypothetical protein [Alkalispirochaeta americana]SIP90267.1 hypothetical protein SAMN05920897_101207 [Alkalispirochaeta americana]
MAMRDGSTRSISRATWFIPLLLLFLVIPLRPGSAWEPYNPFEQEEAPAALFSLDREDAEVEIHLLGSWLASTRVSWGFALHPKLPDTGRRVTAPYPYRGFETEPFSQTLDLVISLWLYQKFFFEASFEDQSRLNTLAAGYIGEEDELIQEVVLGNVPLTISSYPYQYTGSARGNTGTTPNPGAVLRLATARTYHELLLQLESSRLEQRRFNQGALEQRRISPEEYLQNRVFLLPQAPVRNVTVYALDPEGSVLITPDKPDRPLRFRRLDPEKGDYVLDETLGMIRLAPQVAPHTTLAASYTPLVDTSGWVVKLDKERTPTDETVPFPYEDTPAPAFEESYGTDPGFHRMTVTAGSGSGRRGVILTSPGLYSPFAAANHYSLPPEAGRALERGDARVRLVHRNTRTPLAEEELYVIEPVGEGAFLRVIRREEADPQENLRFRWMHPFADRSPRASHAAMYGPGAESSARRADFDILLEYEGDSGTRYLDGDIVPGTVTVTRNGRPLGGARIDYDTGEILLPRESGQGGEIEVRYRVYTPDEPVNDLVVIGGTRWEPRESLLLTLAGGLRWSVGEAQYSREMEEHPGHGTVSAGATFQGNRLSLEAAAAAQLYQPDTTGYFRLFGGEARSFTLAPRERTLFPSSFPEDLPGVARTFPRESRAIALYRDYWETGTFGSTSLQPYQTSREADPDREGARLGPYLARSTDSAYTGTVGVLEWQDLADDQWVGALLRAPASPADLRDTRQVTVTYRYLPADENQTDHPRLDIHLGALGEDLDGDGTAATGRSALDPTFPFIFPEGPLAGSLRRAGQDAPGLTAPHREDPRRDGVLLEEVPQGILSLPGGAGAESLDPAPGWQRHTVTLTPQEAERLADLRGVRFLVTNPGNSGLSGRLLIGEVELDRRGNATITSGRDRNALAAVQDDPATPSLRSRFGPVRSRFNPDDRDQPVLKISWEEDSSSEPSPVRAEFPLPDFSVNHYDTLVFYAYLDTDPDDPPPEARVELTLAPYRGAPLRETLTITLPAEALQGKTGEDPWREITLNLSSGSVAVSGWSGTIERARLPRDRQALLHLGEITLVGVSPEGALYFDELHARDPRAGSAFAGRLDAAWTIPLGPGTLTLEQGMRAHTEGFRGSESDSSVSTLDTTSRASYRQERFRVSGELALRGEEGYGTTGAAGHHLVIPLIPPGEGELTLEEEFYRDFDSRSPLAERRLALSLGDPRLGRYRLSHLHRSDDRETLLNWKTRAALPSGETWDLTLEGTAELTDLDRRLSSGDYSESWQETGRFVLSQGPSGETSRQERRASVTGEGSWHGAFLHGASLKSGGSWRNRSATAGTQRQEAFLDLTIPHEQSDPGRRLWRITPRYQRTYSSTRRVESDTLSRDASLWARALHREPVILSAPPLAELFLSPESLGLEDLSGNSENRSYESRAGLGFTRSFASRLQDLILPAEAEGSLQRRTLWEGDTRTDTRTYQITATARAINLFGSRGSRPLTERYESDEFRNRLSLSLIEAVPGEITRWETSLLQETTLLIAPHREASLVTTLTVTGNDEVKTVTSTTLGYQWRQESYPPLDVLRRQKTSPFLEHQERLTASATRRDGNLETREIQLGHSTTLVINPSSEIRLYADLGWYTDTAEYDEGALHIFGIQAGVEGVLRY